MLPDAPESSSLFRDPVLLGELIYVGLPTLPIHQDAQVCVSVFLLPAMDPHT